MLRIGMPWLGISALERAGDGGMALIMTFDLDDRVSRRCICCCCWS